MRFVLSFLTIAAFAAAPAHAARCGEVSFYGKGDGFAWQTMANGQLMNPSAMTTAHRTLPLGSEILVRNPANGKSVRVTVTDRGPFHGGRELDLSYGAFARIASPSQGVAGLCWTRLA